MTADRLLRAGKRAGRPNQTCVEVEWQKMESGACRVTYQVNYKTASGDVQFTDTVVNEGSTGRCGIPSSVNITSVELKMNSTSENTIYFQASVTKAPIPSTSMVSIITSTKTSSAMTSKVSILYTTQAGPVKGNKSYIIASVYMFYKN